MARYTVRLWVDIIVEATSPMEAKEKADKVQVEVVDGTEIYEIQTSAIWDENRNQVR